MDLEQLKNNLKNYKKEEIIFKRHALNSIALRGSSKEFIIEHLLNPVKLVDFEEQGLDKYKLIFYISNSKTMILPVVLKEKRLYILTFIMRYRAWKKLVERGKNEKNGLL
ncbi:hypothetical protein J4438_03370 [Candidatus Woesearchaeota archaeon]|nr:hypothetical protein [Candidatus Woesearchaeota archaeon]